MTDKTDLSKYLPKTKAQEQQENIERKKTKQTKLSNKSGYQPKFFNQTSPENFRQDVQSFLDGIAEKYNVRKLNVLNIEEHADPKYDKKFGDRDFSWAEDFFAQYLLESEGTFEQAWWRDQCIDQISSMIWNLSWKTVRDTWKQNGTYPGAEQLPRKIRKSFEGVAEYVADQESEQFKSNFK